MELYSWPLRDFTDLSDIMCKDLPIVFIFPLAP